MKRSVVTLTSLLASTLSLAVFAGPGDHDVTAQLPLRTSLAPVATSQHGVTVVARDEQRGLPSFAWATGPSAPPFVIPADRAASWHLGRVRAPYRLTTAALATARAVKVHDIGRGGIVVTLRQSIGGVEVMHSDAKVLMRQNLELVAVGGALHPHATASAARAFALSPAEAVSRAVSDVSGKAVSESALGRAASRGAYDRFTLPSPSALVFTTPARAKAVYFPIADRLVPAYYVEVFVADGGTLLDYGYVISADDESVLSRKNLTASDTYDYRVWADTTAPFTPFDGPHENYTPHPTGQPDGVLPAPVVPNVIGMEGFNHNPNNVADPWLSPGATESVGNNVDAYVDAEAPDGLSGSDFRATISGGALDHSYDLGLDPRASTTQSMAAVTQLFYVTNWLHDWFYDSGFDEAAGNAQASNFGRGGEENDALRAEAQDYSGTNNANMNTPADGERPRMQMYTWSAPVSASLDVTPLGLAPAVGIASFGPQSFDVTGPLVAVDDASGTPSDGCEPIVNDLVGRIALADRGNCNYWVKAQNAQDAGAVGLVIANNQGPSPMGMSGTPAVPITIGVLSVGQTDGDALDVAIDGGRQTAHLVRETGVQTDSSLDNGIIAHEWGHFIHHRLVSAGNPANGAMSEGWGDFLALYMLYGEGEDPAGTYATAVFAGAAFDDAGYFGIRRFPYSTDLTKNALSFRHVSRGEALPTTPQASGPADNAEVHNAGEIWATMLWDAYQALIARTLETVPAYDFATAQRRMADYVVAGMLLTPQSPTFSEARDGILAAAYANDPIDGVAMAEAFAGRGLGTCAVSPPRFSNDFVGLTEGFELAASGAITLVTADDATVSCDRDGFLDGGESGVITVMVANTGFVDLENATITVTAEAPPGVTVGNAALVPTVGPFADQLVAIPIDYDKDRVPERAEVVLNVTLASTSACATVEHEETVLVHVDEALASSTTETVDTLAQVWSLTGPDADLLWSRERVAPFDSVWHGADRDSPSDTAIESPDLVVHASDPLVIDLNHAYSFEGTPAEWWDGGVIEITRDGGASWEDVSMYADPGYDGIISSAAGSTLAGRMAFSGDSASYPALEPLSLDLGTSFAGETVRMRFRIATDQAAGGDGWFIDQIAFSGLVNAPFPVQTEDDAVCDLAPLADAGPDQEVTAGELVTLDASGSGDPAGDPITFGWSQSGGMPDVTLAGAMLAQPTFTAPPTDIPVVLTFEVSVSDGTSSSTDEVAITVLPPSGTGSGGAGPAVVGAGGGDAGGGDAGGGGAGANSAAPSPFELGGGDCGCRVGESSSTRPSAGWLALAGLLAARRRRKRA